MKRKREGMKRKREGMKRKRVEHSGIAQRVEHSGMAQWVAATLPCTDIMKSKKYNDHVPE